MINMSHQFRGFKKSMARWWGRKHKNITGIEEKPGPGILFMNPMDTWKDKVWGKRVFATLIGKGLD